MISESVIDAMRRAFNRIERWPERLDPEVRARLADRRVLHEIIRRSYIDAYWRVCETTPLILRAVEAFNHAHDRESADFWLDHLREEIGHDVIQRGDLAAIYGQDRLDEVLRRSPMSPPSAAVIAYFRWQVERGSPHMLMIYRLFLELFTASMADAGRGLRDALGDAGSRAVVLHCELDGDHVGPCAAYLDRHFGADDEDRLLWSVRFIGECLVNSQLYVAGPVLED